VGPAYFKENKFFVWATSVLAPQNKSPFRVAYLDFLKGFMELFEKKGPCRFTNIIQMAESLKNGLIGNVHMPHSHMIDHGIQAITYVAQYN